MTMENLKVNIGWNGRNHEAICEYVDDVIVASADTLEAVKKEMLSALAFHFEDQPISYSVQWVLKASALLRNTSSTVKIKAISRISGLNEKRLGHYAQGRREANDETRSKIVGALQAVADELRTVV